MHDSSLRERLKNSEMAYPLKITLKLKGVSGEPCQPGKSFLYQIELKGCKTLRRNPERYPEDWEPNSDEWCFEKCEHPIDLSVLSKRQLKLYKEKRPIEKQKFDYTSRK